MADTLATLGLVVDDKQVIRATGSLEKLTETGKRSEATTRSWAGAADRASQQAARFGLTVEQSRLAFERSGGDMQKLAAEIQKLQNEAREASQTVPAAMQQVAASTNAVAASKTAVAAAASKSSAQMNALRSTLVPMAAQLAGLNPMVARLASTLGLFAVSSGVIAGALAALGVLGFAWNKLTEDTREARRATEEAIDRLRELRRERMSSTIGTLGNEREKAVAEIARLEAERGKLFGRSYNVIAELIAEQQTLIEQADREIARIVNEDHSRMLEEERRYHEERNKIAEEAAAKALRIEQERAARMNAVTPSLSIPRGADGLSRLEAMQTRGRTGLDLTTKSTIPRQSGTIQEVVNSGGGVIGQFMGGLQSQFAGLAASLGPAAIAAAAFGKVMAGVMDVLGPALQAIAAPLESLGRIFGTILEPFLRRFADALQLVVKGLSYLYEGFGSLIKGIGQFVDKVAGWTGLDWGRDLARWGQDMIDSARAARDFTSAVTEATRASANIPDIMRVAEWRARVGAGGGGGSAGAPGSPGHGFKEDPTGSGRPGDVGRRGPATVINVHIARVDPFANNLDELVTSIGRKIERNVTFGGTGFSFGVR